MNERLVEKYVQVEEKTASTCSIWLLSEKMEENGLHEPKNQFSLENCEFLENGFQVKWKETMKENKARGKKYQTYTIKSRI